MSVHLPQTWEYQLLSWAEEAFQTQSPPVSFQADSMLMGAAYHHCDAIIRTYSRTFYIASGLLPEEKRRAVRALYAFCRITDNIVDSSGPVSDRLRTLENWRATVTAEYPSENELIALAWADTQQRFNIPRGYALQLIDGVARDLTCTRYATFPDLAEYAYGVASTVGLMAMHIVGFQDEQALPYAVKLGVALQLTNILRDVAEDWKAGRLYLPLEELRSFGLTEEDIAARVSDSRWQAFMRFQIERNRTLYSEALNGLSLLNADGRFAIAAAAELYCAILTDIEAHHYNVFDRRAHIGLIGKIARLPRIWWRSRGARMA